MKKKLVFRVICLGDAAYFVEALKCPSVHSFYYFPEGSCGLCPGFRLVMTLLICLIWLYFYSAKRSSFVLINTDTTDF